MKNLFSLVLMLLCTGLAWGQEAVTGAAMYVIEENGFSGSGTDKDLDNIITSYSGDAESIVIPATLLCPSFDEQVTITEISSLGTNSTIKKVTFSSDIQSIYIAYDAFEGLSALEEVILPATDVYTITGGTEFVYNTNAPIAPSWSLSEGVLTVYKNITATSNNYWSNNKTSITKVVFSEGVTTVGAGSFYDCKNLKEVTLPKTITTIGDCAFQYCTSLESIEIPNSVTVVVGAAFSGCSKLSSIKLSENQASISSECFRFCTELKSIYIPASVTSIAGRAFEGCNNLSEISVAEENKNYSTSDDGRLLYSKDKTELVFAGSITGEYTIDGNVTEILGYAFYNSKGLTSVVIPEGVTKIGNCAFAQCGLTKVKIPASVTSFGDAPFSKNNLEELVVAEGNTAFVSEDNVVYSIDKKTLTFCSSSKAGNFVVPNGVETIGGYAFYWCDKLTSITFPNSVTSIGSSAFSACNNLSSITIYNEKVIACRADISSINLYVPESCIEAYKEDSKWKTAKNILGLPNSNEDEKSGWQYSINYSNQTAQITGYNGDRTKVEIPTKVDFNGLELKVINVQSIEGGSINWLTLPDDVNITYSGDLLEKVPGVTLEVTTTEFDNISNIGSLIRSAVLVKVPEEKIEAFKKSYPDVKIFGDGANEENSDYDEETNTLQIAIDENTNINDIATIVNSGATIAENIIVTLDGDLDLTEIADEALQAWQQIGTEENPFTGTFDGGGNSIKINEAIGALFGTIGQETTLGNDDPDFGIKNLNIVVGEASANTDEKVESVETDDNGEEKTISYYGLLAQNNYGTIRNTVVVGSIACDEDKNLGENPTACLVANNEGVMDHVVGYFGTDEEETANKASIIVIQNIGRGRTKGRVSKSASNGKAKGNSALSYEPDEKEIKLNYRLYTDEEFASGEPAYWLNFDGEGYSGSFSGEWAKGSKHPVKVVADGQGAAIRISYILDGKNESEVNLKGDFFANEKSRLKINYDIKPDAIKINGTEVAATIGADEATIQLSQVERNAKGEKNVTLVYNKSAATSIGEESFETVAISANGKSISVSGGAGQTVEIFDIKGRMVVSQTLDNNTATISLPVAGIYVVKVGDVTEKVVVRSF
ncbi:MAG: leucine-rich repeat protein [Bacteroidales bacterium]|nr:leucine-rich repeat protein [Bacteroidales bacterium]